MARHDAFVSYSRRDKAFAVRLEQRLEKYKAPSDLPVRQGHLNIFRDEKDFTGADYFESLQQHLQDSETLIVVCSPHARASEYVNDEIRRFVALKGADRIIPILVSGIPNNEAPAEREADKAFPEALSEALPMPLAANYLDFNLDTDRVDREAYLDAWFTVLANIYRVSRSEIEQRERKRRARFIRMAVTLTATVVVLLVVALVVTLLSRAEAVRQAIEARSETSTRLAVQALEKIEGRPETAVRLAIDAVETYHKHGDPPVSRALEALHRARLSFGGGRPVMPSQPENAELVFSDNLVWAAAATDSGEVLFTRAGSGEVVTLKHPPLLIAGEAWADEAPVLLFTRGRLIAGRGIVSDGKRQPRQAAYWYWPLSKQGIEGDGVAIARFPIRLWNRLNPVVSPGGRWLSWYGKGDTLFVKDLDSTDDALEIESEYDLRTFRVFSRDETQMLTVTDRGLVVLALANPDSDATDRTPTEVHRLEESHWDLEQTLAHSAFSIPKSGYRCEQAVTGLSRVAIVDNRGDAVWWDLSDDEPQRRALPNVFTAFAEQLRVWRISKRQVKASLEFSPCARMLLVTVAENDGDFGVAAHIDLDEGEAWKPIIVEQLKGQLHASMSRTRGTGRGVNEGYNLMDRKQLGVAHATWFTANGLLTVGFDGSLEFHDPQRNASQFLSGGVTSVNEPDYLSGVAGISAGTRSGELRIFDMERSSPIFVLSAHDEPVETVIQAAGGRRVVTVTISGRARIWKMNNPVLRSDSYRGVSDDWRRFYHGERSVSVWGLRSGDPLRSAVDEFPKMPEKRYAQTHNGEWVVERIPKSGDASASTVNLRRRTPDGGNGDPVVSRLLKLPFPAKPDTYRQRWLWGDKGYLTVTDTQALLLITGKQWKGAGVFLFDLYAPDKPPVKLLNPADGFVIDSVAENMSRMLIKHYGEPGERLEVRDLLQRDGEAILGLEGRRDSELSNDGRWLVADNELYDLSSTAPVRRTQNDSEYAWGRPGIVFKAGRPPLWLDEAGDLWGLDHAAGARSPPRLLLSGLGLSVVSWSEDGSWLGLGGKNGEVRVAVLGSDARFAEIEDVLDRVGQAPALPDSRTEDERDKVKRIRLSSGAAWLSVNAGESRNLLWRRVPDGAWQQPIAFINRDSWWRRDAELVVDDRWLIAENGLYDFSTPTPALRANRDAKYKWRYPSPVFKAARPPLWIDEAGDLWGLDHATGSRVSPQRLVSGLDLSEIAWSEGAEWLGLGSKNGDVRIAELNDDVGFTEIKETLAQVASQPALPRPWDERALTSVGLIKMSYQTGWVSARMRSKHYLLWRAAPEGGWRQPIVLHESDGLSGYSGLQCRPDGQQCFLQGQLLIFDESQLIGIARSILPDG